MKTGILIEGTVGDNFDDFIAKVVDRRKRSDRDLVVNYNGAYFRVEEKDTLETLNEKYLNALANIKPTDETQPNTEKNLPDKIDWETARITAAVGFVTVALGRMGFVDDPSGEIRDNITAEAVKYADTLIAKLRG